MIRMSGLWWTLAILACFLASCGNESTNRQSQAAARIGLLTISDAAVIDTMNSVWPMSAQDGGKNVKPPRYEACVETRRPRTRRQIARARAVCRQLYGTHLRFAMVREIERAWLRLALRAEGIDPPTGAIDAVYRRRLQALPPAAATRMRTSAGLKLSLRRNVREEEVRRRLSQALRTEPTTLDRALARLYGPDTACAARYRGLDLHHCGKGFGL